MKKYILYTLLILSLIVLPNHSKAVTDTVDLSTDVMEFISISVTQNDSIAFGNLTPGSPLTGSGGTRISVTTSSQFGYDLAISDSVTGSNSTLLHTNVTDRIADYAGTIGTPTIWSGTGLGASLYSGTGKAVKWGSGTTYNDALNKYAGIPENSTVIMEKSGYLANPDLSYIGWKVDVPNNQLTGSYAGSVTLTATAKIN